MWWGRGCGRAGGGQGGRGGSGGGAGSPARDGRRRTRNTRHVRVGIFVGARARSGEPRAEERARRDSGRRSSWDAVERWTPCMSTSVVVGAATGAFRCSPRASRASCSCCDAPPVRVCRVYGIESLAMRARSWAARRSARSGLVLQHVNLPRMVHSRRSGYRVQLSHKFAGRAGGGLPQQQVKHGTVEF